MTLTAGHVHCRPPQTRVSKEPARPRREAAARVPLIPPTAPGAQGCACALAPRSSRAPTALNTEADVVTRLHLETWFLPHLVAPHSKGTKNRCIRFRYNCVFVGSWCQRSRLSSEPESPPTQQVCHTCPAHEHVPEQAQAGTQPRESPRAHLSTHKTQPSRSLVPRGCAEPRTAQRQRADKETNPSRQQGEARGAPQAGGAGTCTCTSPRQHGGGSPGRAQKEGCVPSSRQKPTGLQLAPLP